MLITLKRVSSGIDGTFGVIVAENIPICVTCENQWLNNKPIESCIPDGKYKVKKYSGTKYKDVWILEGVPNRSAILIHNGNTEKDTNGCIIVGDSFGLFDFKPAVFNSVKTIKMLRAFLPDEFELVVTGLGFVVK